MTRPSPVHEFFKAYRRHRLVGDFFEAYRKSLQSVGRLPEQNFLLGAGIIRHYEVNWCQVLRWLLDPLACRTMAGKFQYQLCTQNKLPPLANNRLYVAEREVQSHDREDRFDIVLKGPRARIIIEAKVQARYNEQQHTRYAKRGGTMLYLVRNRDDVEEKRVADCRVCEWADVAQLLDDILRRDEPTSALQLDEQRWRIVAADFADLIRQEGT
jgi:hypothetical protein